MPSDWSVLLGGYKVPYDPRPAIKHLAVDPMDDKAWEELWDNLHHQGDIGDASYAALPLLVETLAQAPRNWKFYGLVGVIELERFRKTNPPVPEYLSVEYFGALQHVKRLALSDLSDKLDKESLRAALGVVALVAGDRELGAVILEGGDYSADFLDEYIGWSELYDTDGQLT